MTDPADEEDLIRRGRRGDDEALEVLVRRHYRPVWLTLWHFERNEDDTDALCQETFLRALRKLYTFRGEASLRSWITRVGINLALNEKRRRRPMAADDLDARPAPESSNAELERRERVARVHDALDGLAPDLKAAIVLTAFAGCSHREAALALGCAEGTVSWRVHEARRKLAEGLEDVR